MSLLGLICAAVLFLVGGYRPSPVEQYFGLPFFSFAFIKRNGMWLDYLGPLTIPALLGNAYVGFTLPFMVAEAWRRLRATTHAAAV
jgi:hypothetical protein